MENLLTVDRTVKQSAENLIAQLNTRWELCLMSGKGLKLGIK